MVDASESWGHIFTILRQMDGASPTREILDSLCRMRKYLDGPKLQRKRRDRERFSDRPKAVGFAVRGSGLELAVDMTVKNKTKIWLSPNRGELSELQKFGRARPWESKKDGEKNSGLKTVAPSLSGERDAYILENLDPSNLKEFVQWYRGKGDLGSLRGFFAETSGGDQADSEMESVLTPEDIERCLSGNDAGADTAPEYDFAQSERRIAESIGSPDVDGRAIEVMDEALRNAVAKSIAGGAAARIERLASAPTVPSKVSVQTTAFLRNPDVIAEVLIRAAGYCQDCGSPAPFVRAKDGTPYLEVHHRKPLTDGGEDVVENAIALCPNCHRRMHFGLNGG